jgi:uncharacterized protein
MTSSQPLAAVLNPQSWDPDLLPPLQMDGFLTGTLLTPNLEVKWVAYLWPKLPDLADDDRLKNAFTAALARRKAIEADLQKGWPGYHPSFSELGRKTDHDKVREWMKGFWKAMKLDPQYWSDLAEDERTATFLALISGFLGIGEPIEERDDAREIRDEHAALLPRAIVGMRKLALMQEGNVAALRSIPTTKVGRNDPCPCGSGKKFKRCCAAN